MKIIQPSFQILRPANLEEGIQALRFIEFFARISHRTEEKQDENSWQRFLKSVVIEHGDLSVIEHVSASVIFILSRGTIYELIRHRLFSYTQESTRFVRYGEKHEIEFIQPTGMSNILFEQSCRMAEENYLALLGQGYKPQEARSILTNALASKIAVTGNLRNWRHLFLMRTTRESHPDIKQIMVPLLNEFKQRVPILFEDVEPDARQIDNLRKPH